MMKNQVQNLFSFFVSGDFTQQLDNICFTSQQPIMLMELMKIYSLSLTLFHSDSTVQLIHQEYFGRTLFLTQCNIVDKSDLNTKKKTQEVSIEEKQLVESEI